MAIRKTDSAAFPTLTVTQIAEADPKLAARLTQSEQFDDKGGVTRAALSSLDSPEAATQQYLRIARLQEALKGEPSQAAHVARTVGLVLAEGALVAASIVAPPILGGVLPVVALAGGGAGAVKLWDLDEQNVTIKGLENQQTVDALRQEIAEHAGGV